MGKIIVNKLDKLAVAIKKGDVKTYNYFYKQQYPKLCNYIVKMSNNEDLAKDIAQNSLILLWEKRKNINPQFSLSSYALKICHNEFLQHIRKKNKERAFLDEIKATTFYEIETEDTKNQQIALLQKTINNLSPKCKEVFIASKFDKLSYEQIAKKKGISKKTVEAHISKAYSELRKKLTLVFF